MVYLFYFAVALAIYFILRLAEDKIEMDEYFTIDPQTPRNTDD